MDIIEFVDAFNNKSFEELVALAVHSTHNLFEYFDSEKVSNDEQVDFLFDIFKLFTSSDSHTSKKEYELFLRLIDDTPDYFSFDEFYDLTSGGSNKDFVNEMIDKIKALPHEQKLNAVGIGLAIICSDHIVTMQEYDLIYKIL